MIGENRSTWRETIPSVTLSTTRTGLESNPDLCGWSNENECEKIITCGETSPSATLSTTRTGRGSKPDLRVERQETNRQSHGTALHELRPQLWDNNVNIKAHISVGLAIPGACDPITPPPHVWLVSAPP